MKAETCHEQQEDKRRSEVTTEAAEEGASMNRQDGIGFIWKARRYNYG